MIKGIKSVDFYVEATGEGVVNHNGSYKVRNPAVAKPVENHLFPKLRGVDPLRKIIKTYDNKDVEALIRLDDPDFDNAILLVSANCVRSHLFKDVSFGVQQVTRETAKKALASLHGLVRGYLITNDGANFARKSPLYSNGFECKNPGLTFNQGSKTGEKSSTSLHSFFNTNSNLHYTGFFSLNIEELEFIPLENTHNRTSYSEVISIDDGIDIAQNITEYLNDFVDATDPQRSGLKPQATFLKNARRIGSFSSEGEAGILLNDDAIHIIVLELIEMISNLSIRQGKGFLRVTKVDVDFNTKQTRRAEDDRTICNPVKTENYAVYYVEKDLTNDQFFNKMNTLKNKKATDTPAKNKKNPKSAANTETERKGDQ